MNAPDQGSEAKKPTWFLLYETGGPFGDDSQEYIGRTTDKAVAIDYHMEHWENRRGDGYVIAITDTKFARIWRLAQFEDL
jgi:hypothetical protein